MSALALANVEALADTENVYPDYSACPILEYNRGYMEAYKQMTWSGMVGASGNITLGGVTFGPFTAYVFTSFNYQSGYCAPAPNNCCKKSHVGLVKAL